MLKKIAYGKTYTAIEHSFINGKEQFVLLILKEIKKEFVISFSQCYDNLQDCAASIATNNPVLLIVNTKSSIRKVVSLSFTNAVDAAKNIFPTIKTDDFYVEVARFNKSSLVTVCRKEIIETLLAACNKHNLQISGFSLGNSASELIYTHFQLQTIQTSNTTLSVHQDNSLSNTPYTSTDTITYDLKGMQLESTYLLSFAALLGFYTNKVQVSNFEEKTQLLRNVFLQKRIFFYGVRSALGSLFLLLLLNFFFFTQYNQKNAELEQETQFTTTYENSLQQLKEEVDLKKELVSNLTENSNSKVSYYLDDLAKDIPNSILLNTIHYQPLTKKIKEGKIILFDKHKLVISGLASKGKDFNQWMHTLESKSWVKSSSVIDYGTGKETKTSFTIYLFL